MSKHKKKRKNRQKKVFRALYAALIVILLLCAAFLIGMANMNSEGNDDAFKEEKPLTQSPVPTEGIHVTEEPLPFITPEPTPIPTPTPEPTPTPVPTPTPEPTPSPTPLSEIAKKSLPNQENTILISAVGDCTLGGIYEGSTAEKFKSYAEKNGFGYYFENVYDILNRDDLTIANLEGVLIESGKVRNNRPFILQGYPEYIEILTLGSVEAVNLANNHTKDFEEAGIESTHALLEEAEIDYFGFGPEAIVEIKGKKIGLLGYTVWESEGKDIIKDIKRMKAETDLVIVSMHGGNEKAYKPTSEMIKYCRGAADAGADLVLGHHTHRVNGIENYNGTTIVYSLSNFVFGGHKNPDDMDSFIFQQEFIIEEDGSLTPGQINVIPCSISSTDEFNDFRPTVLEGKDGERVLKKIAKYSKGMKNPYTYEEK